MFKSCWCCLVAASMKIFQHICSPWSASFGSSPLKSCDEFGSASQASPPSIPLPVRAQQPCTKSGLPLIESSSNASVMSSTDMASERSCLLAYTSRGTFCSTSDSNKSFSRSLASLIHWRSQLSITKTMPFFLYFTRFVQRVFWNTGRLLCSPPTSKKVKVMSPRSSVSIFDPTVCDVVTQVPETQWYSMVVFPDSASPVIKTPIFCFHDTVCSSRVKTPPMPQVQMIE
mmetsp:Transcript_40758/g.128451  ORF Transcript_40758/g.128451 Transcript_40758/m.128451 type:complete len:229 (+) Transcript_40758:70-756(+)